MKHVRFGRRLPRQPLWAVGAALLLLAGCAKQNLRAQAEDDGDQNQYSVETVRDWATFDGADPVPVGGVGLVTGLANTGGDAPPGDYRSLLEKEIARDVDNRATAREILADPHNSMVLVSALVPPAARKGDPIDVEVTLPQGSKTTSLQGGYLEKCRLFEYAKIGDLAPNFAGNNQKLTTGHVLVEAEGRLLVGLGDGDESVRVKQGRVWAAGPCKLSRPLYLYMNQNRRQAANAKLIADRINETFRPGFGGAMADHIAEAKNDTAIVLNVPQQYRLNLPHYMRVVGLVPVRTAETAASKGADAGRSYRKRLEDEVLDPAHTVTAALRLEALGESAKPVLKLGLRGDSTLVRFCCAEGLAYLGDAFAAAELARLVDEPALRAFCLTALASLDESVSYEALAEMLNSPVAETRYGAFRALRALNDRDDLVQGEKLNDSFWLHHTAPGSPPLVHVSSTRRAEVVLFGDGAALRAPLSLSAGEFNVTAADGDAQCTISRFSPRTHSQAHGYSSLRVEDVIRKVADMGGDYAAVVGLLRQARRTDRVTCAVEVDALPQATSVYALKRAGLRSKKAGDDGDDDDELLTTRLDLGATPTLFERDAAHSLRGVADATPRERRPSQDR